MYIVYIDDEIANVFNNPVSAKLYAEQLKRDGHEDVAVIPE